MGRPVTIIDKHAGEKVRYYRMIRGITQAQLAKQIKVSFQQLQKYERGENRMTLGILHSIASRLGIPVEDFFDESDDFVRLNGKQTQRYSALLEHFTKLNNYQQQALITYLRAMTKENE